MKGRERIEGLWAQGLTGREIQTMLGLKPNSGRVSAWRARGYDLPHRRTPEQIARITADGGAYLAKARRVFRETKSSSARNRQR